MKQGGKAQDCWEKWTGHRSVREDKHKKKPDNYGLTEKRDKNKSQKKDRKALAVLRLQRGRLHGSAGRKGPARRSHGHHMSRREENINHRDFSSDMGLLAKANGAKTRVHGRTTGAERWETFEPSRIRPNITRNGICGMLAPFCLGKIAGDLFRVFILWYLTRVLRMSKQDDVREAMRIIAVRPSIS